MEHLNVKSSTIGLVKKKLFLFLCLFLQVILLTFRNFFFPKFCLSKFVIYVFARTLEIDIII